MGKREFFMWVEQMNWEMKQSEPSTDSWKNSEQDPFWVESDQKRRELRGR